ncbi:HAMP domain-containing protein [Altericroceibacterium spongiae]|uniref:histidine kinase n=1 Tax=Altericroceibacterium spongiae TaxID=2320269 RepID=A0A420EMK0_9SPHN|nr:ATP-binding protein [Altericroceibacterium spongiae]RKF21918.1 HAMP domain-containing protein [Altericroceibacterium spongiae]
MAERSARGRRLERLAFPLSTSLTARILAVNIIALTLLGGSLLFLDSYRRQLLEERFKLASTEAQITAEALTGVSETRQEELLAKIGREQHMRLQLYSAEGHLLKDNFILSGPTFTLIDPDSEPWLQDAARALDRGIDWLVRAEKVPDYAAPASENAPPLPEVTEAHNDATTTTRLRYAPDRTPVITAATPLSSGTILLTTRNALDITQSVRDARQTLAIIVAVALFISIQLSLYLARTIVEPLRMLVRAAVRVRRGRDREVEVPRMSERRDEIGLLARAVSDMTTTLRQRIDAVETFAADVAHEIKNPLASLRSAIDSLTSVEDPALRAQLTDIAAHDVRRIDRLVTEIAEASRIDAELSRATFEQIDLSEMIGHVLQAREGRGENRDCRILIDHGDGSALVMGVAARLERVIDNLLDNAVSFSPPGGCITIGLQHKDTGHVEIAICDEGPGIPANQREDIFTRFHSVRPESENFGDHSGLGLAIARTIAEAHDGKLQAADRTDGKAGACLILELPAL